MLSVINMYAVLGTLENLCELDKEASELVKLNILIICEGYEEYEKLYFIKFL